MTEVCIIKNISETHMHTYTHAPTTHTSVLIKRRVGILCSKPTLVRRILLTSICFSDAPARFCWGSDNWHRAWSHLKATQEMPQRYARVWGFYGCKCILVKRSSTVCLCISVAQYGRWCSRDKSIFPNTSRPWVEVDLVWSDARVIIDGTQWW